MGHLSQYCDKRCCPAGLAKVLLPHVCRSKFSVLRNAARVLSMLWIGVLEQWGGGGGGGGVLVWEKKIFPRVSEIIEV